MKDEQLINKKYHILQRKKILLDNEKFIYKEVANRINDSLEGVNFTSNNCLEIGFTSNNINNYLTNRFKNIDYSVLDISTEITQNLPKSINAFCFDHDEWRIQKNNFNLIISNLYLNLSNNIDKLLFNINHSLKDNGFFISTIPGINFLRELKDSMIISDLKIYNGAYRRFMENLSIQVISKLLKKNNFKNTVIDIETINLKYDNFSKLLNDVKYLGCSYMYNDKRKIIENKGYLKEIENTYWKRFSKNGKLYLTLEIIFFSGWK